MSPNHLADPDIFSVLGDARRRHIVELLARRDWAVGELAAELGIAQPSVTQHLAALREVGLVTMEKQRTSSIYTLVRGSLAPLGEWVDSLAQPAGDSQ